MRIIRDITDFIGEIRDLGRRETLQATLEQLCKEDPKVAEMWQSVKEGEYSFLYPDFASYVDIRFRHDAMSHVRNVLSLLVQVYGAESKEFAEVTKELLSWYQRRKARRNVQERYYPQEVDRGIKLRGDRRYDIPTALTQFNKAIEVYEKYIRDKPHIDFGSFYRWDVESNPLYKHLRRG